MDVNQLKYKLRKRKPSVWYQYILYVILLIALKEKAQLCEDGEGLTIINKIK